MADVTENRESSNKELALTDILKIMGAFIGVITVLGSLVTGTLNYKQSVRETLDVNFRGIIEALSSKDVQDRLAAAASLGTFIHKEEYRNEAVDILINRLSVELDYNVLNTIRGSLKRVDEDAQRGFFQKPWSENEDRSLVQKLLDLDRSLFLQKYAVKKWKEDWEKIHKESFKKYLQERDILISEKKKEKGLEIDSVMLENLEEETSRNWEIYYKRDKDFKELAMHQQAVTDFIASFLEESSKAKAKKGLLFKQNNFNFALLIDIDLSRSIIRRSAFSSSTITNTIFDGSRITHTFFTDSDLEKSSFKGSDISLSLFDNANLKYVDFSGVRNRPSSFEDVFFAGSELTNARFEKVKGIKAVHFYGAKNIEKAIFDDIHKKIPAMVNKIAEDDFISYVLNSELTKGKKDTLLQTIDGLRKRYDYFVNALITYALFNRPDAEVAVSAAYMTASDKTVPSMTAYIDRLISQLNKESEKDPQTGEIIDRLTNLKEGIKAKIYNIDGIIKEKERLGRLNREYLDALERGDAEIFIRDNSDFSHIFKKYKTL